MFRKLPGICSTHQRKHERAHAHAHTHTHTNTAHAHTHKYARAHTRTASQNAAFHAVTQVIHIITTWFWDVIQMVIRTVILSFITPQVLTLCLIYSAFASFCPTLFSAVLTGNSVRRVQASREQKQN